MKKISRILSFLFSALFAVVFAFSAWCGWMLQYSIQNYFTLQEKFSWMGSSPGDWEARFQTWSAVALGYVAPVLFLLLIGSLILAKRSWKSMICHLFFTFAAGFFLILITRFIPVLSLPNRTVYVPFFGICALFSDTSLYAERGCDTGRYHDSLPGVSWSDGDFAVRACGRRHPLGQKPFGKRKG